jgi:hypothetical protein
MAGLVPAIQVFLAAAPQDVDARNNPGMTPCVLQGLTLSQGAMSE